MKFTVSRSKAIPAYLQSIENPVTAKKRASDVSKELEVRKGYEKGRMTTAQFRNNVDHIEHSLGVFEESNSGNIWEAGADGCIYRRDDETIKPIIQALSESSAMTDEEYKEKLTILKKELGHA